MTEVKVCGVTTEADAVMAADLGARLIGLNFHPSSPRCVEPAIAGRVAATLRRRHPGVKVVGVFVRMPPPELEAVDRRVGFDLVQFHGDEGIEEIAPYAGRAIKVWRWEGRPPEEAWRRFESAWGFLLDRKDPAGLRFGGTGESWDYRDAASLPTSKPVLLAGGIGPANVRAAIAAARPWGVDVCSRVESEPGRKSPALLAALFREIRDAEAQAT